jgi:hypothetical protein
MSMARLTTSLPPSPILDIVVGSLTENIGVLFSLMKRGETASDAYYLWEVRKFFSDELNLLVLL